MPAFALQVIQLLFGVGIVGSFVWAMVPRRSASERTWTRRRAEWLSVTVGLLVTYLLLVVVKALAGADGVNPFGVIPFLTLAGVVLVAVPVLRAVWQRAAAAAAAAAEREASAGGTPVAEQEPPPRHRGFSGEATPPTRW